ncbi:hypothetical protein K2Q00_00270 [Patescibacteria group bacterium]|nr:hypothetical protein [Patescibacteria group bacterium]
MAVAVKKPETKSFDEIEPGRCFRTGPFQGNRYYVKWDVRGSWIAIELVQKDGRFKVLYTDERPGGTFEFFGPEVRCAPTGTLIRNLTQLGWKG